MSGHNEGGAQGGGGENLPTRFHGSYGGGDGVSGGGRGGQSSSGSGSGASGSGGLARQEGRSGGGGGGVGGASSGGYGAGGVFGDAAGSGFRGSSTAYSGAGVGQRYSLADTFMGGGGTFMGGGGTFMTRNPEAGETQVVYHCMTNEPLPENQHMCIRGSLEVLGNWEFAGVIMERHPTNPNHWIGTFTLPFSDRARGYVRPLFEFKYCLEGGTDAKPVQEFEADPNRRIWNMASVSYHSFRKKGMFSFFGGGSSKNEAHFGMYLEDLLNSLVEGTMDVAGFLNAYDDLRDNGFKENFLRRDKEPDVVGEFVEKIAVQRPEWLLRNDVAVCAVSIWGQAVHAHYWRNAPMQGQASFFVSSKRAPRKGPFPRTLLDKLSDPELLSLDAQEILPPGWAAMFIRGVSSIMELHGAEGDYSFLNVVPLLWHLDKSEQVDVPVNILTSEKAHANFVEQARRLDLPALFEKDAKLFDVVFRAVIFYAPTIEILVQHLVTPLIATSEDAMKIFLTGVHNKLRRYSWPSKYIDKELESFLRLINEVPQLSSDATMINFLRNHNVDFADTRFVISGIVHSQCMQFETSSYEVVTAIADYLERIFEVKKGRKLRFQHQYIFDVWNEVLEIPCFFEYRHRLLESLATVLQLDASPLSSLDMLLGLNMSHFKEVIINWILKKASTLISSSGSKQQKSLLRTVTKSSLPEDIKFDLLFHLLPLKHNSEDGFGPNTSAYSLGDVLTNMLQFPTIWEMFFEWIRDMKVDLGEFLHLDRVPFVMLENSQARLYSVLVAGYMTFLATYEQFLDETITLGTLRLVFDNAESFWHISKFLRGSQSLSESLFTHRRQLLDGFETHFRHVGFLVNIFCNTNPPIRTDNLGQELVDMSAKKERLRLCDVKNWRKDLPMIEDLPFIAHLRGSQTFINLWKIVIHRSCVNERPSIRVEIPPSEREIAEAGADAEGVAVIPEPRVVVIPGSVEQKSPNFAALARLLIPRIKSEWETLYRELDTMSIVGEKLTDLFLGTKYGRELEYLSSTYSGEVREADKRWVDTHVRVINDFALLIRQKRWIPAVRNVCEMLKGLFSSSVVHDQLYQRMVDCEALFKEGWEQEPVESVMNLVEPVSALFKDFSFDHLDYLEQMTANPPMIEWLLEQSSTENFNSLINVCKSSTDDPMMLRAFASVTATRTLLNRIIYNRSFENLTSFLREFSTLDLKTGDALQSLITTATSFETLLKVFEHQTRSPGVKACYDLKDILDRGVYCFRNRDLKEKVTSRMLVCRVGPGAAAHAEGSSEQETSGLSSNEFDLEELLDLRNKLMLTEVPPELAAVENFEEMIARYVEQLRVLSEMKDTIYTLYWAGHFNYQDSFEKELSASAPVAELEAEALELYNISEEWKKTVAQMRRAYYFLNFFNMRQILLLVKYLDRFQAKAEEDARALEMLKGLLRLICRVDMDTLVVIVSSWSSFELNSPEERLDALGKLLDSTFRGLAPDRRTIPPQNFEFIHALFDARERIEEVGMPVALCTAGGTERVIDVVLSIYASRGRLPEPEELLLCDSHTEFEDMQILLYRWISARQNNRGDRIFCIGNVDMLTYTAQCRFVDELRAVLELHEMPPSVLVLVSGLSRGQHLLTALSRCVVEGRSMDEDELKEVFRAVSDQYSNGMHSITSQNAGSGKSDFAMRWVAMEGLLYQRIPIREGMTAASLISAMRWKEKQMRHYDTMRHELQLQTEIMETPSPRTAANFQFPSDGALFGNVAHHFDLSPNVPRLANMLLFELLIVGLVQDRQSGQLFYRQSEDAFLFEVANSPNDTLYKRLRVCQIMPKFHIEVSREHMQVDIPEILWEDRTVRLARNEKLQYVVKYLQAFDAGAFEKLQVTMENFDPFSIEDLGPADCFDTLVRHCGENVKMSNISFATLATFYRFMYEQFVKVTNYPLLQNVAMSEGLETFKNIFIKLLISTSVDFAMRSVDNVEERERKVRDGTATNEDEISAADFVRRAAAEAAVTAAAMAGPSAAGAPNVADAEDGTSSALAALQSNPSIPLEEAELQEGLLQGVEMEDVANQFLSMRRWEESNHPFVCFYHSSPDLGLPPDIDISDIPPEVLMALTGGSSSEVSGVDIISLDPSIVTKTFGQDLKTLLSENGIELEYNWRLLAEDQVKAIAILRAVAGLPPKDLIEELLNPDGTFKYVITVDNLLKMLSILMRVRCGIPTVIMGETGCGKSELIRFLARVVESELFRLNVHGGILQQDIMDWMRPCIATARENPGRDIFVFFDEINTTTMGLFKEIVCDRFMLGELLPDNIKIIAACNPYRLKKEDVEPTVGLVFQYQQDENPIPDPLEKLVYRVLPLPDTMLEYVFDYGALPAGTETLYTESILKRELYYKNGQFFKRELIEVFTMVMSRSQDFMRSYFDEVSAVSLRDIVRTIKLFKFFCEYFSDIERKQLDFGSNRFCSQDIIRRALVLSVAHCYHNRLTDVRPVYRGEICNALMTLPRWSYLRIEEEEFRRIIWGSQRGFAEQMDVGNGDGIALNQALCENLFMIFVSILNKIPIFVIGKPGSSKSLAVEIISSRFNGEVSRNEFLRCFPPVQVFSYQCSPLSTAQGIEQTFHSARRYQREAPRTCVVVLLDEVGLAEQSPHLPLKVLHAELEHPDLAVVGISNWVLDPAKINRGVHLARPAPGVEDLCYTAKGIVNRPDLEAYLRPLAVAYNAVYTHQGRREFFGLRDFYSIVKDVNRRLQGAVDFSEDILLQAVVRNFGGKPSSMTYILEKFAEQSSMDLSTKKMPRILDVIKANTVDVHARHMMLLTKNNAALRLLFDKELLSHTKTEVIFGSDFPGDKSDLQICLNIQRIKLCMSEGWTVVLVHCENLYESLYDLLNQHYSEYGGQRFVRIALGNNNRLCPVHINFRVIVVVDREQAYQQLPPPLLNRFEKQVLLRQDILSPLQKRMVQDLSVKMESFVNDPQNTSKVKWDVGGAFVGFHNDLLSSLVLTVWDESKEVASNAGNQEEFEQGLEAFDLRSDLYEKVMEELWRRLTWIITPESIVRAQSRSNSAEFVERTRYVYYQEQNHESFTSFLKYALSERARSTGETSQIVSGCDEEIVNSSLRWGDHLGLLTMLTTFSPLSGDVMIRLTEDFKDIARVNVVRLHEISTESDMSKSISEFFASDYPEPGILVIQCEPIITSVQRVHHVKYLIESIRGKNYTAECPERHVIILVHVHRAAEVPFTFDFDKTWGYAFVDSVESNLEFGSTTEMLNHSIFDLVESLHSSGSLSSLLRRHFRMALSLLLYPYRRTGDSVRTQIRTVMDLLMDAQFLPVLESKILRIVKEDQFSIGSEGNWQEQVASNLRELCMAGSYHQALSHKLMTIILKAMAIVMSFVDRNYNLAVFKEGSANMRNTWMQLWDKMSSSMSNVLFSQSGHVEVPNVSTHSPDFHARFPFAYLVTSILQDMRPLVESFGGTPEILEKQIEQTLPMLSSTSECSSEMALNFLHDYIAISSVHLHLSVVQQAQTCQAILLRTHGPGVFTSLSTMQTTLWTVEKELEAYFRVLDVIPAALPTFLLLLESIPVDLDGPSVMIRVHLALIQAMLSHLLPDFNDAERDEGEISLAEEDILSHVTAAILSGEGESESWRIQVQSWLLQFSSVRSTLEFLLSRFALDRSPELMHVKRQWRRLRFTEKFVRDVALSLKLPRRLVQYFWHHSDEAVEWPPAVGLRKAVALFTQINRYHARHGDAMECFVCLEIPREGLKSVCCRRVVCRSCASDIVNRAKAGDEAYQQCVWCRSRRMDSLQANFENMEDHENVHLALEKEKRMKEKCSLLVEFYIRTFIFEGTTSVDLTSEVASVLIDLIAGEGMKSTKRSSSKMGGQGSSSSGAASSQFADFQLGIAARISILRTLLRQHEGNKRLSQQHTSALVEAESRDHGGVPASFDLMELLQEHIQARTSRAEDLTLSFDLALLLAQAMEDSFLELLRKRLERLRGDKAGLNAEMAAALSEGCPEWGISFGVSCLKEVSAATALDTIIFIAFARTCLTLYSLEANLGENPYTSSAELLLSAEVPCQRNLRLFVVKQWDRRSGSTFARSTLKRLLEDEVPWVLQWVDSESLLTRFATGSSCLPSDDPFHDMRGFGPLYRELSGLLSACLNDGQIGNLAEFLESKDSDPAVTGALLLAVFNTVQVSYLSAMNAQTRRNAISISRCVLEYPPSAQEQYRALMSMMASNTFPERRGMAKVVEVFQLGDHTTLEHVLLLRIFYHSLAVASFSKESMFGQMVTHPEVFREMPLPSMPQDLRAALIAAMGGGWYECPNGHTYYVSECGMPMQEYHCPECGATIGGSDHVLVNTNRRLDGGGDKSPLGYSLRVAEEEKELYQVYRQMNASSLRFIRLFVNCCFLGHVIVEGVSTFRSICDSSVVGARNPHTFLLEHIQSDLNVLRQLVDKNLEDTCTFVHFVFWDIFKEEHVLKPWNFSDSVDQARTERNAMEAAITAQVAARSDKLDNSLREYRNKDEGEGAHSAFLSELAEQNLLRQQLAGTFPLQLRYRKHFSVEDMRIHFTKSAKNMENFPLLAAIFLKEEEFAAVRYLYHAIRWHHALITRFNRKVERSFARENSVGNILAGLSDLERPQLAETFDGFRAGWQLGWRFVERYQCLEIPQDYKDTAMNLETPLSFCTANETDESICMLAFLQHFTDRHNELIQAATQAQTRAFRAQQLGLKTPVISSRQMDQSHMLAYDFSGDIAEFVRDHSTSSLSYGEGGSLTFDFASIEEYIVDRFFAGKPQIQLEIRVFDFIDEQRSGGGGLQGLRSKLPQSELPADLLERIRLEIGSTENARVARRMVETCISFLQATGGKLVMKLEEQAGEELLYDYVRDTLLMTDGVDVLSSSTLSSSVRLKHLISFYNLLESMLVSNPLMDVHPNYKSSLSSNMELELRESAGSMDLEALSTCLREFAVDQLKTNFLDPESSLKAVLSYVELPTQPDKYLSDFTWFDRSFPDSILMKHWVATYEFLSKIHKGEL